MKKYGCQCNQFFVTVSRGVLLVMNQGLPKLSLKPTVTVTAVTLTADHCSFHISSPLPSAHTVENVPLSSESVLSPSLSLSSVVVVWCGVEKMPAHSGGMAAALGTTAAWSYNVHRI